MSTAFRQRTQTQKKLRNFKPLNLSEVSKDGIIKSIIIKICDRLERGIFMSRGSP